MLPLTLTSRLSSDFADDLEKLLFFNPQQSRVTAEIQRAVAEFGMPGIHDEGGCLRIRLERLPDAQSLYVLAGQGERPELVGLVVLHRRSREEMMVIHLALHHERLARAGGSGDAALLAILQQLRSQLGRIKGVTTLRFSYLPGRFRI